ncbi:hypothetical protein VUG52_23360 [Pseudomonas sp. LH21]|uniref:hypothetical protein n=1 Tax=Pseudomonas sp. LH21 TaxID=3114884 RepID=UPI002F92ABD6
MTKKLVGVHIKSPLEFISTSISRANANNFLSKLWDKFNEDIGNVGCAHYYRPTVNPEIYDYRIHWADNSLSFEAELHFYNHTSKGIFEIGFGAIDNKSQHRDMLVEKKIRNAINYVLKANLTASSAIQAYMCIAVQTKRKLSGHYRLLQSDLLLTKVNDEEGCTGHLFFPVKSTNEADLAKETEDNVVKICSRLTTLTQNLFTPRLDLSWGKFTTEEFGSIVDRYTSCDIFVDDSGFRKYENLEPNTPLTGEIIETGDCVINSLLALPERADTIMRKIALKDDFQQACARFAEGLHLRELINSQQLPPQSISYEIIAYTATIEALLDSEKVTLEVNCPNCDTIIAKEEWKISEKYKAFVNKLSINDFLFKKYFRPLYEDRSKFVHTAKDLFDFTARRAGRPAKLLGRRIATSRPEYYENIHELTGWLVRKHMYESGIDEGV